MTLNSLERAAVTTAGMAKPFAPSEQQQAFIDWILHGKGSCILEAVAGAGKSTTVLESLVYIPEDKSAVVLSFNADITTENKAKLAAIGLREGRRFSRVRVSTFHSTAFATLCKAMNWSRQTVKTDSNKLTKMCRAWLGEDQFDLYASFICKLVDLAKGEGIGALVPDTDERWYTLIQHHDLTLDSLEATEEQAVALARELLERSTQAARNEAYIDFNDMLYLIVKWKIRMWLNHWVFIDEAQDTNPVRRAIARLSLYPGATGRLVAVGDRRQGIYGFTGASHDAMDLIKEQFNCAELKLGVSYRCSVAAVERAKRFVPWIEAAPGARAGEYTALGLKEALVKLGPHDAILCRNTAPLVDLAFRIIAGGRGCTILGKDIAKQLVDMIKGQRAKGVDALRTKLLAYRDREVASFVARGEEGKAESITDRVACILTVADNLKENERTIPKMIEKLEGMFSDTNGVLTLATGHKAKGKQWMNVGVYKPELMPSKWARQEHQMVQEENLQYVIDTRTMNGLYYIIGG